MTLDEAAASAPAEKAEASGAEAPPPRPERMGPGRARWGLGDAALGLVGGFLGANVTVGLWAAFAGSTERSLGAMAAGWIGLWAGLVGVPLLKTRRKGTGSLAADFGLSARPNDGAGLAVGALCQLVALPTLYFLIQRLTGDLDVSRAAPPTGRGLRRGGVRGGRTHGQLRRPPGRGAVLPRPAAAGSSAPIRGTVGRPGVIGGLRHVPFPTGAVPGAFAFGVVLAVLALRTGRLGASIAAHVAFNAVAVIGLVLAG